MAGLGWMMWVGWRMETRPSADFEKSLRCRQANPCWGCWPCISGKDGASDSNICMPTPFCFSSIYNELNSSNYSILGLRMPSRRQGICIAEEWDRDTCLEGGRCLGWSVSQAAVASAAMDRWIDPVIPSKLCSEWQVQSFWVQEGAAKEWMESELCVRDKEKLSSNHGQRAMEEGRCHPIRGWWVMHVWASCGLKTLNINHIAKDTLGWEGGEDAHQCSLSEFLCQGTIYLGWSCRHS